MARITMIVGYRGRKTKEQFIPPGIYDEDDPRLNGLGSWLVKTGRAYWMDKPGDVTRDSDSSAFAHPEDRQPLEVANFQSISGIGEAKEQILYDLGITTFADLANADALLLAPQLGVNEAKAQVFIDAAIAHLEVTDD